MMIGAAVAEGYAASWSDFAVAEVGAAAALAGLLVVATSINIARIVQYPVVVSRLLDSLILFTGVLFAGSVILVPGQGHGVLGIEIAAIGVLMALIIAGTQRLPLVEHRYRRRATVTLVLAYLAVATFVVAGVVTALDVAGGLYWLVPGVLLAFAVGLVNAWVALVEILR